MAQSVSSLGAEQLICITHESDTAARAETQPPSPLGSCLKIRDVAAAMSATKHVTHDHFAIVPSLKGLLCFSEVT